jgi:mannan endo-1,4-beta-mannosidase
VGHDIVAPDGTLFYPIGANVGMPLNFDWRGTVEGHSADALAWGWNTVRLTILCTNVASWDTVAQQGYPFLRSEIDGVVQEYTAKHIVVMIECHDLSIEGSNGGLSDPLIPQLDRFWTDMARTYKSDPYVWFDANNEPPNDAVWTSLHQHFLNLVRAQGAQNIYVADGPQAGEDAGWNGGARMYDPSMGPNLDAGACNVLFSVHNYGGTATDVQTWTAYVHAIHGAGLALIGGEFGYTIDGSSTAGSYQLNLEGATAQFQASPSLGVGMLWWHGTHGDNYSLKQSGDAFYADGGPSANLSPAGQRLWDIGHSKPSLGRFTGDLRQSNCPSAG